MAIEPLEIGADNSLLLVDDDEPFLKRLAKAMEKRGFSVEQAGSVAAGRAIATARPPAYARSPAPGRSGPSHDLLGHWPRGARGAPPQQLGRRPQHALVASSTHDCQAGERWPVGG